VTFCFQHFTSPTQLPAANNLFMEIHYIILHSFKLLERILGRKWITYSCSSRISNLWAPWDILIKLGFYIGR
jgi:hypothetical protein